ncbi:cysteine protease ATG4C isoform X4 [Chelonoidis abingdonii]|uniref:cysteine protease ATG4C isoform X4 n=1 Tax=Chelonoidis abingdonii TaxID=106734 RepID=UPI0013F20A76|nr:cysteine protease ATG4C isoform X4 [Chelonoidis abingdonii]
MEATGTDEVEKLKSKFMSAWHNMKYSWVLKTKTYFSRNSAVVLLGKCYCFKSDEPSELSPDGSCVDIVDKIISGNVEEFRKDFISRIWLTYREDFPQIKDSALTTDCGWGCTLRTGQMLLAQGLVLHFLGRAWTWPSALNIENSDSESWTSHTVKKLTASFDASLTGEREPKVLSNDHKEALKRDCDNSEMRDEVYHRKIISWFGDSPPSSFGLHQLIEYGKKSGKTAGDWYGPAVVAHILRKAVEEARDPELQGITIYVAQDCTVYSSDVVDRQCSSTGSEKADMKAVIILVPVRLGGERTNMDYLEFVKSFHCPSPKKMSFKNMDPSCTIGFYCRNMKDFERISEEITKKFQKVLTCPQILLAIQEMTEDMKTVLQLVTHECKLMEFCIYVVVQFACVEHVARMGSETPSVAIVS